jgi:ABC-type amino acid transport substrate-binding protein
MQLPQLASSRVTRVTRIASATCIALAISLASACDMPADAEGTLARVRGSTMRVGVTEHPPWDSIAGDSVSGVEPRLIARLASQLGTRVRWRRGSESELLDALERRELDLVAVGLTDDSPWNGRVAFTRPYATDRAGHHHVLALSSGENAWLVTVERFLESHAPDTLALAGGAP